MSRPTNDDFERTAREYDRRLGSSLFAPWANHTIAYAHLRPGDQVLDVACGTGSVAIKAQQQVTGQGKVIGLDLNPGMLVVAREKSSLVEWLQGNAESLPFDDNSFDAVLCQFGLMLFPDPVNELGEMFRVLKPGRHLVITVFDGLESLPVYRILAGTYGKVVDEAISELLRVPFSMGDRHALNGLFSAAGIPDTELVTKQESASFTSVRELVLADIKGWFPFAGILMTEAQTEAVVEAAEMALAGYLAPDGSITFPVSAHLAMATKRGTGDSNRKLAI